MKIGILGAGKLGGTLGVKWAKTGHQVIFGVRDPGSPRVQDLLARIEGTATTVSLVEAASQAEVVVFAIPSAAMDAAVEANAQVLAGKIVIDTTNKFGADVINSVDLIRTQAPTAKVYRAFNTLGWENFQNPYFGDLQADLFYCGARGPERQIVEGLIEDIGLKPIRVGDLDVIQLVDNLGALWVTLVFQQGMDRQMAFKALMR